MSGIHVELRGSMSLVERWIRQAPQRNLEATLAAGQSVADDVKEHWSGNYPPASSPGNPPAVRSGELDASVIAIPEESLSSGGVTVKVTALAAHASYLEFGTRYMAARPFLRPAISSGAGASSVGFIRC
jgi:HK97 gp10 family phage protein